MNIFLMSTNSYACLNDFSIRPWNMPKQRQERFCQIKGSTTAIDYLGLDFLNLRVGDYHDQTGRAYHLHASASKFLAEIVRISLQERYVFGLMPERHSARLDALSNEDFSEHSKITEDFWCTENSPNFPVFQREKSPCQLPATAEPALRPEGRLNTYQESQPEAQREILFAGSIAIYQPGEIPGSQIRGYNLVAQGRIWASAADIEAAKKPGGLRDLVLGKFNHPDEAVARVESIIREFS